MYVHTACILRTLSISSLYTYMYVDTYIYIHNIYIYNIYIYTLYIIYNIYTYIVGRWIIHATTRPKDGASFEFITAGSALVCWSVGSVLDGIFPWISQPIQRWKITHLWKDQGDPPWLWKPSFMYVVSLIYRFFG